MRGPDTAAVVAVKVFVELQVLPKMRIFLQQWLVAEYGSTPRPVIKQQASQSPGQLLRNIIDGVEFA